MKERKKAMTMTKCRCIGCKKKMDADSESLLCPECYDIYAEHMGLTKKPGTCPVCGGHVDSNAWDRDKFNAGTKVCSDHCRMIAKLINHHKRIK
jgi:rRNA maturation endonuclease Nob1